MVYEMHILRIFLKRAVYKSINIANYIVFNKYCEHTCIVTYLLMHYSAVQSTYTIANWNNVEPQT